MLCYLLMTFELAIACRSILNSSSKLPCQHPGTLGNMCIVCGQNVEEEETGLSFTYIHKFHQDEVTRMRDIDMKMLQSQRKLCLVLDLDHSLLNSTVLRDLKPEEEYLKSVTHSSRCFWW